MRHVRRRTVGVRGGCCIRFDCNHLVVCLPAAWVGAAGDGEAAHRVGARGAGRGGRGGGAGRGRLLELRAA